MDSLGFFGIVLGSCSCWINTAIDIDVVLLLCFVYSTGGGGHRVGFLLVSCWFLGEPQVVDGCHRPAQRKRCAAFVTPTPQHHFPPILNSSNLLSIPPKRIFQKNPIMAATPQQSKSENWIFSAIRSLKSLQNP